MWKARGLGEGYVTPSVAAGRIFTMGNRGGVEYVIALSEDDGQEIWAAPVGTVRGKGGGYPGPRSTPTLDGERVYALGLSGDLLCLDVNTGQQIWRKDLDKDYAGQPGGWGYCESPLVDGEQLIVTPGGDTATLAALDKNNGQTLWKAQVPQGDHAAYSSVIAADVDGERQYIQFLSGGVVGFRASDGKFLWRYDAPANGTANISTPLFWNNHVFAASNYGAGGGLAKLSRNGDTTSAQEVYVTAEMQNHHGGVVLVDRHLYGNNGGRLACLDFRTGKVAWQSSTPGKGSIACADGCLYYRNEGGSIRLIEANPKQYVELGRFDQPDRSDHNTWAHPVIANGKLYIADQDVLLCYDVQNTKR